MAYVTPAERVKIEAAAAVAGMSLSSYIRAVSLGRHPKSVLDLKSLTVLAQVNSDQTKLAEALATETDRFVRSDLLKQIIETQGLLGEAAKKVKT